ncbi:MAG: proteasome subunit beta [Nitrospirae bacterium]|nr:proteasome subunit beta [Nitrospirota bacterium]MBI3593820.1 proteasome subunit beta [Nitrospirota bacterium]
MKNFEFDDHSSSFYQFLTKQHPHLLEQPYLHSGPDSGSSPSFIHGTTILALKYADGVVIAGDRRATEGHQIADRTMKKIFKTDDFSAMGISGAAGPCIDMVRLFKTEIEHYEKLEGSSLTLEGKANKLGEMIKANLPLAFQGLIVIPIFAGYDLKRNEGRIFKYDITGGRYEEAEYYSTGSGGKDAKNSIKKMYRKNLSQEQAIRIAVSALYDASEEDSATGGPDLIRGIYPIMNVIKKEGISEVSDDRMKSLLESLLDHSKEN